jgi:hypothetical protein
MAFRSSGQIPGLGLGIAPAAPGSQHLGGSYTRRRVRRARRLRRRTVRRRARGT